MLYLLRPWATSRCLISLRGRHHIQMSPNCSQMAAATNRPAGEFSYVSSAFVHPFLKPSGEEVPWTSLQQARLWVRFHTSTVSSALWISDRHKQHIWVRSPLSSWGFFSKSSKTGDSENGAPVATLLGA